MHFTCVCKTKWNGKYAPYVQHCDTMKLLCFLWHSGYSAGLEYCGTDPLSSISIHIHIQYVSYIWKCSFSVSSRQIYFYCILCTHIYIHFVIITWHLGLRYCETLWLTAKSTGYKAELWLAFKGYTMLVNIHLVWEHAPAFKAEQSAALWQISIWLVGSLHWNQEYFLQTYKVR